MMYKGRARLVHCAMCRKSDAKLCTGQCTVHCPMYKSAKVFSMCKSSKVFPTCIDAAGCVHHSDEASAGGQNSLQVASLLDQILTKTAQIYFSTRTNFETRFNTNRIKYQMRCPKYQSPP